MHHVAPVVALLHGSLPWVSWRSRVLIESMVLAGGATGSCDSVARDLGFKTRFGLTRALRKEGLPSLGRLSAWIRVLIWTWNWEHNRTPIGPAAVDNGKDPAVRYRLIRRTTKQGWRAVKDLGSRWVLQGLLEECSWRGRHLPAPRTKRTAVVLPPPLSDTSPVPYAHFGSPSLLAGASGIDPT
jgi:hypothetical protein